MGFTHGMDVTAQNVALHEMSNTTGQMTVRSVSNVVKPEKTYMTG